MLKTYIIDDEQPAINILTSFIKKTPFLHLVGTNTNALETYPVFKSDEIDLLFLDIQMPDITGIEFLQSLERKPMVIFTTAFDQYALQGYELDVIDYLVKPIPFQRFLKGANKALKFHQSASPPAQQEQFITIKSEYKSKRILCQDILHIEGLKDYVKIYTTSGMELTRLNLKGIEERLPADQFLRIHRSHIIAISKIESFQKSHVFIGNKTLPIGDSYRDEFLQKLS